MRVQIAWSPRITQAQPEHNDRSPKFLKGMVLKQSACVDRRNHGFGFRVRAIRNPMEYEIVCGMANRRLAERIVRALLL
jgi:hypothetical protein